MFTALVAVAAGLLGLAIGGILGANQRDSHCPHVHVRGIYGDEINHTPGYRRNECLDCGRLLDGPVSISRERGLFT